MNTQTSTLSVGLAQQACGPDKQQNLANSATAIQKLADDGAQLIVLQELHATRYFCQTQNTDHFDLSESIPGPTTDFLAEIAQAQQVVIVASLFERRAAGLYHNTAVVIERDGTIAGKYRKMHIPDDPGFNEKFYFTPGDLGFRPISTSVGKLGVLVCWDQWYPEAARLMTLAGAELLIYPTAIGSLPSENSDERQRQLAAWTTVQRGHAIANVIPVIVCNRVGYEAADNESDKLPSSQDDCGIQFWGSSFVAGVQGEIIAQTSADKPEILLAQVDLAHSENTRRIWPFLRDRRIDAYDGLLKRYTE